MKSMSNESWKVMAQEQRKFCMDLYEAYRFFSTISSILIFRHKDIKGDYYGDI